MYPGEDTLHPAENRGIAGPISTIQLANLRRGLQDHLYLTLAQRCGLVAEVSDALQAVVPRVFSDQRTGRSALRRTAIRMSWLAIDSR